MTIESIELAEGTTRDLDAVMVVMGRAFDPAFGEAWTASQCLGVLGLPGVWLLIASKAGGVIGFALSRRIMDEAELLLVAVDPEHRGQGVARALIDRTCADAAAAGATRLHLEMREGNPAARLYAEVGFVEVGRRRGYYSAAGGRLLDALTLMRDLARSPIEERR